MQLHAQYYYQQLPPQERAAYHGMLTCLRELTPSARKAMPFASLKEARDDVLGKAEAGHPAGSSGDLLRRWFFVPRGAGGGVCGVLAGVPV